MSGHVFECFEEQNDRRQYGKTVEALDAYARKTLSYSADLAPLFATTMMAPTIERPDDIVEDAGKLEEMIFAEEVKEYVKRTRTLKSNLATIFAVAWGQCSEAMKARVKTHSGYDEMAMANDCVWLLKQIRSVTLQFHDNKDSFMSLLDAQFGFLSCKQKPNESADEYAENLIGWSDTIETHGGTVAVNFKLIGETADDGTLRDEKTRQEMARERTIATCLIRNADPSRYGTLITDLANQYAGQKDNYPKDIVSAKSLLVMYKTPTNATGPRNAGSQQRQQQQRPTTNGDPLHGLTLAQRTAIAVAGTDSQLRPNVTCYGCGLPGHMAGECPTADTTTAPAITLTQYAYVLAQAAQEGEHEIDPDWILLDSQSTISVFKNASMLTNIRHSGRVLRAITNGGHQDSVMVGDFPNLGEVWFNRHSIANILSLAEVRKVCRVTMDTFDEPALIVHRIDGSTMKFVEHPSGLYIYKRNSTNVPVTGYSSYTMVSTVAAQKRMFSRREIRAADVARELYRKIGRPAEAEFQRILKQNLIMNCPVTPDDAKRAHIIYGPDVAVIKGKTTRSAAAPRAPTFVAEPIPPPILEHHRNVTLCADFFFVQGLPFFHTISRGIGFRTADPVPDRTKTTILTKLRNIIKRYTARGLTICDIHGDNELECTRTSSLLPIALNVVPADSHVGEIERSIRTVKERLRSCAHGLPFKRLPRIMVAHMVSDAMRCLNQFPWPHGISNTMSPNSIVTGTTVPDYNHMRIEFGTYVQLFEDNTPSNTLKSRSVGAIALSPTGNAQGDYFFMSLATGKKLSRASWTALPMTDAAIARVEAIALHQNQPLLQSSGLVVEWRPDQTIDESEYDLDYSPTYSPTAPILFMTRRRTKERFRDDDDNGDSIADDDEDFYGDDDNDDAQGSQGAPDDAPDDAHDAVDFDAGFHDAGVPVNDHDEAEQGAPDEAGIVPGAPVGATRPTEDANQGAPTEAANQGAPTEAANQGASTEAANQGAPTEAAPHYNLRPRVSTPNVFQAAIDAPHNGKSYFPPRQLTQSGFTLTQRGVERFSLTAPSDFNKSVFGYIMNQMTAQAGIKKHGKAAEAALMNEFAQLEELEVYESVDPNSLTWEQRKAALKAINLIKEKRDGTLKGRTVADGRRQRFLYDKSETASPTVSKDALMLSILIDAYENRDVGTADVVGAYLKAFMDDYVLMKFVGASVDILCEMNPEHIKNVAIENGVKVLYVRLIKAIYGCVKSALLWYDLFYGELKEMGFVLNPYDSCIANCEIKGKQCTIAWYVDDAKISHVDPDVVTSIIDRLEARFDKMTVTRGLEHSFLGMKIRYTGKGTAVITMKQYLEEALSECGMDIVHKATTPAQRNLFDVNENSPPLEKTEGIIFHSVCAKLLYVSLRARVDILLPIAFLCTRVTKSTQQDQSKLKRVLEYLKGHMDDEYVLGADDMGRLRTWVDAAFAVHPDMKSHTGGVISFGRGGIACKSGKQKLVTKSSTEAETVGASDYLPNTLWVQMFLEAQGYSVHESYFEQDNESAIKLETNGRISAGPKSRHINIRYFWIKDRSKDANITIRHCPTLAMLADFFTKPLQGNLFRKFKAVLLGQAHVDTLALNPTAPVEERVGEERSGSHGRTVTSVVDTVPEGNRKIMDVAKLTWADDVVRKPAVASNAKKIPMSLSKGNAGIGKRTKSASVLKRSFSQNNPVNRIKV
ncbi:Reverse transcriptase (RNA-dependent DNA polymerase) [Fragilaria crotonensis]|nr:Reverse transcriptase (RNA-dependent DNA polymerase) [Fragilaria crotonensis]